MHDFPIISALIALPVLGGVLCLLLPREEERTARYLSLTVALVTFFAAAPLFFAFEAGAGAPVFQFTEHADWVPGVAGTEIGLSYRVGLDGMTLLLVILTAFLTPIGLLASWTQVTDRVQAFVATVLFLEAAVIGVFAAMDLVLFYVFWEAMLLPMVLLIGMWGGKRRIYAAYKFFIYTMAGSLLMLAGIVYVYLQAGQASGTYTFDIQTITLALNPPHGMPVLSASESTWLFLAFGLAFAIKVPIFPFHTWLPDAHTEAPTAGSVMLAAVLLKMGTYGLIRLAIPFFPEGFLALDGLVAVLAVIGIVYGALMAMAQDDMKRLIAYSSVSHLGFVVLGIVAWNAEALVGAVYQMLGHGLSTGALFLVIGLIYERHHTREIARFGGMGKAAPGIAVVFMIAMLSSVGLPGLNGFVGEFLILLGVFQASPLMAACGALGVILGAVYLLTLYQRVMLGRARDEAHAHTEDLTPREWVYMLPLCALMGIMGVFPAPFLSRVAPAIDHLLALTGLAR